MELATTRIKRLLELISSYSFNLYYMKGKVMVLSDFLLQQSNDDSNPNEIIPISFNTCKILEDNREKFDKCNFNSEKYLIQAHSQAKMSDAKLPEVHRVQKELDPNLRPEKQHATSKQGKFERLWMGQGRAGTKRRKPDPINQAINQPSDVTQGIQRGTRIVTGKTSSAQGTNSAHDRLINNNNPFMPDIILHQDPLLKSPKQQNTHETSHNPNINLDFEENSPFQEGIMSKTFQRLDKSFFQNPKDLRRPHKQGQSDS